MIEIEVHPNTRFAVLMQTKTVKGNDLYRGQITLRLILKQQVLISKLLEQYPLLLETEKSYNRWDSLYQNT